MEQFNQNVSSGRSGRIPVYIAIAIALAMCVLAIYAFHQKSEAIENDKVEKVVAPSSALGRTMSTRLERLSQDDRPLIPEKGSSSYLNDYFEYLALYESPADLEPIPDPTLPQVEEKETVATPAPAPATPTPAYTPETPSEIDNFLSAIEEQEMSAEERLQHQLRQRRAEALLNALSATSTIDSAEHVSKLTANGLQDGGTAATTANNGRGNHNALSAQQQYYLNEGKSQLAALQDRVDSMSGASAGMGMGMGMSTGSGASTVKPTMSHSGVQNAQTLSAYDGLVNEDTLLPTKVDTVLSPYLLRQGALIPCVLLSGINSDLPGLVQAQVTEDVFDTPRGNHVLIPRGSKIIGQYASGPMMGQERMMLGFNRVIFPDGKAMSLGAMIGSSSDGYSGFDAEVDNHFWRLMGNAILLGGITAGVAISVDDDTRDDDGNLTVNGALSQSLGQSLGRVMTTVVERNLAVSPTLKVKPGFPFNVTLTKDIYFPGPYRAYTY